jgi:hypothetical protein
VPDDTRATTVSKMRRRQEGVQSKADKIDIDAREGIERQEAQDRRLSIRRFGVPDVRDASPCPQK